MIPIKMVWKKYKNCVLSLLVFYENIITIIFKVLCCFIYFIMDNYLCVDCLCLQKCQLSVAHKVFNKTQHLIIFQEFLFNHYQLTSCLIVGLLTIRRQLLYIFVIGNLFPIIYQKYFLFLKIIQIS